MKDYLKNIKKILFILISLSLCSAFFGSEKPGLNDFESDSFSGFYDDVNNNVSNLNFSNKPDINNLKKNYSFSGFQSSLYRSGLYMLGFGAACGILGGVLFGLSYLIEWYLAGSIGWAYESVVLNLFVLESTFSIQSYYTTIAIAFWVSGIVLMALSVLIIPGIILMAIDGFVNAKRLVPLKEAVGFAIKF